METTNAQKRLIESYMAMLSSLSAAGKLELISRLSEAVRTDLQSRQNSLPLAAGVWGDDESAGYN